MNAPAAPILFCPKCAAAMKHVDDYLTCVDGDMPLSRNLENILLNRFGTQVQSFAPAPPPAHGKWFCPACRVALDASIGCPVCGGTLKDLLFQLVEIHPHRGWPTAKVTH